jgi:hypothetical protein
MKHGMVMRIQDAIDRGALPSGTSPIAVFRVLLAAIHGVATLRLCDRLASGEDGDALARATLEAAIKGLQAGALLNASLGPYPEDVRHDS